MGLGRFCSILQGGKLRANFKFAFRPIGKHGTFGVVVLKFLLLQNNFVQTFAAIIYGKNLRQEFTARICGSNLRQGFAASICGRNLRREFAARIRGNNLRLEFAQEPRLRILHVQCGEQ